jgi:hypothetical protein
VTGRPPGCRDRSRRRFGRCRRHGVRERLALTLGADRNTLLVDADPLGAGIDRVLGMESIDGIRWDALHHTTGRLSARSLREALPRRNGVSVLTWAADRPTRLQAFAMREVLSAGQAWPRGAGARPATPSRPRDRGGARPARPRGRGQRVTVPAVTATSRVTARLVGLSATSHLVVRGSGGVDAAEIGRLLGLPVAAAMPTSVGSTRRSTSVPGRCAHVAARSPGAARPGGRARGARGRTGGMSGPAVPAGMLEQVRDQLARDGAELTPEHVAQALRDRGRPGG